MRSRLLGTVSAVAIVMAALSLDPEPVVVAQTGEGAKVKTIGGCPTENPVAFHKCALQGDCFEPPLTRMGSPTCRILAGFPTTDAAGLLFGRPHRARDERPIMTWEPGRR